MAICYPYQNRTLDTGDPRVTLHQGIQQRDLMKIVDQNGAPVTPITPVVLSPLPAAEVRH